jgi:hypothetical protein
MGLAMTCETLHYRGDGIFMIFGGRSINLSRKFKPGNLCPPR